MNPGLLVAVIYTRIFCVLRARFKARAPGLGMESLASTTKILDNIMCFQEQEQLPFLTNNLNKLINTNPQ